MAEFVKASDRRWRIGPWVGSLRISFIGRYQAAERRRFISLWNAKALFYLRL